MNKDVNVSKTEGQENAVVLPVRKYAVDHNMSAVVPDCVEFRVHAQ